MVCRPFFGVYGLMQGQKMTQSGLRHPNETNAAARHASLPDTSKGMSAMIETRQKTIQVGIRQRSLRKHCRLGRATELVFVLATGVTLALSGGVVSPAMAQDRVWDGQVNTLWSTNNNWDPNGDPAAGVNVIINSGALASQPTLNVNSNNLASTTISSGTLTVDAILNSLIVTLDGTGNMTINAGDTVRGSSVPVDTAVSMGSTGTLTNNGTIQGSLTVSDGITGNAGVVTGPVSVSGGTLRLEAGTNVGNAAAVSVSVAGTLEVNAADTVDAITMTGGTIQGAATLTSATYTQSGGELAGTVSSTVAKTLEGGTISGTLAGAGATTIQNGITTVTGSIVGDVTVGSDGVLRIESADAVTGTITTTGSTISLGDGQNEGSDLVISSATTAIEVLTTEAAEYSGVISATDVAFGLAKTGEGNLTLSGANTYSGETNVNAGTLTISNNSALGTTASGTTVADGATLALTGGVTTSEEITLNGTGVADGGALRNVSGNNTVSGAITLDSASRINSDANLLDLTGGITGADTNLTLGGAGIVTVVGVIGTGTGTLTKDGSGIVALLGTNTFTGDVQVNGGFLQLAGGNALADSVLVTVGGAGHLQVGTSETVGNIAGAGGISLGQLAATTLTVGDATPTSTFSGTIIDDNNPGSFGGGLTKQGSGTLILSGANSYSGLTTINAGTLQVGNAGNTGTLGTGNVAVGAAGTLAFNRTNTQTVANVLTGAGTINQNGTGTTILTGSNAAGNNFTGTTNVTGGTLRVNGVYGDTAANLSVVNVNTGGTLQGTGTIRGTVNVNAGGTLAPGASPGVLNIAGNLVQNAASTSEFELGGPNDPASVLNDKVIVGGTLTLDGTLNVTSATLADGYYRLFEFGSLVNNGLNVGTLPLGASAATVLTNVAGQVNLRVGAGPGRQFWDGAGDGGNGVVNGGTGTWNASNTNWTISNGNFNDSWLNADAVFQGTAGTVTVSGTQAVSNIEFGTPGYLITGGQLALNTGARTIEVIGAANTATIASVISGSSTVSKTGAGTLRLTGVNTYSGATTVTTGALVIGDNGVIVSNATVTGTGTMTVESNATAAGIDNAGTLSVEGTAGAVTNTGTATITGSVASLTNTNGTTTIDLGGIVAGNTSVSGGAIVLTDSDLDDASTVTVSGTGTLTVNTTDTVGVLDQTGGTIDGNSTLTVTGAFTQTGGATDGTVTVDAGSFAQDGGTIGSGTTVTSAGAKTLDGGTIGGTLTGTGAVTVQTGTTNLNGTISGGATTIATGGVLNLTGDSLVTTLGFDGGELTASADATLTGTAVGPRNAGNSATISAANGVTLTLASDFFVRGIAVPDTTTTFGSAGNDGTVVIATTFAGNLGSNAAVVIAEGTVVVGSAAAADAAFDNFGGSVTGVTTTVDATLDINGFATNVANLAGAGDIVNNGADAVLTLQTDQDSTFDGVIADGTGAISVEKVQGGTQILTADQAYTGTTTITAGVLQAGNGGVSGSFGGGDIIVNAPGTAALNRSDDVTVANLFIGDGTLVHDGTGTTTLTASNSAGSQFTGTAEINAGTVRVNGLLGDSVGNSATLNVNSGGTLQGTGTVAGTVNVLAGGTIAAGASPGTLNIGGDLVLAGTSEFELGNADVFGGNGPTNDLINVTGSLTLGGDLVIVNSGTFGPGYYRLFNHADAAPTGSFASVTNPLAGTTATVLTNIGQQVNLRVSDGSTPVQFWDGADFTGNGTVDGGAETWNAGNTNWTNANGSFNDSWLSGEGVFQGTAADVTVAGAQTFQGLTFNVAGYALVGGGTLVSPTDLGFSVIETNGNTVIDVAITGAGGINKTGTADLNLGAQSTYLGITDVAAGTLRTTVNNALPSTTNVTVFNNATLDVNGTEQNITSLTGLGANSTVALGTAGQLFISGSVGTTYAGAVTGGNASILSQGGTGSLTFTATSASPAMTGILRAEDTATLSLALGATTGALRVGAIGSGTFIANGGALANNATIFTEDATATVRLNGSETVGFLANGTPNGAGQGTIDLNGASVVLTLTGNGNATNPTNISEHAGLISGTGGLTVSGGTHRLSGAVANTYQGVTTVSGGTLELAGGVAIRDAGVVNLTGNGTLRVVNAETIGSLDGAATAFLVLDETLTTGGNNATTTMAGVVSGAGGLTKLGTGTFTLSNANTYAGLTTVGAGILNITNSAALGSTAAGTTVTAGATLQLTGPVAVGAEALTLNGAGVASGGALRSLSGANSWAGNVTLGSAAQITTVAGSLTIGGTIANGGNLLTITGAGATTLNGVISGAGGLTKQDAGTLTLGAANTYTGATTINAGTVNVNGPLGNGLLNTASVAVNGTSILNNAGTINTASTTTVATDATFNNTGIAGAVTNNGTLTNSGTLQSLENNRFFTSNAGTVVGVSNNNGGTVTINSGTFTGGFNNLSGTTSANGAMTGNVTNAGTFTVTGALTGGAGTFGNTGTLNVGANYTGLGLATNGGTVNLTGTTLGTAGLTNTGTVIVTGISTLDGGVAGSGTVNLGANDLAANTLNLTGPAGSVGANTFVLGYAADGTGDRLVSGGGNVFSGATQTFNATLQGNFALGTSAVVVQGQTGLATSLNVVDTLGDNLNTGGALLYSIADIAGNTALAVEANPAVGGIASGVSLTQSLVANVVNRPSSPFASGLASELGCSQGGYARAVGGRAEAKGSSFSGVVNRENSLTAKYFGVQAGYDFICNDGRFFDGWNGGAGALLGYNKGSTDQPVLLDLGGGGLTQTSVTKSDFDQKYAGFYVVGNKDRLTVDAQVRFENTKYTLNESPVPGFDGLGLNDSSFSTRSTNFTGRVSYNIPINEEGLNFVPTAGFSITRTGSATLDFTGVGLGNRLVLDAYTSKVGFIGGTLAKTRINEEAASGSTLFVSGNYYHEFGGDRTATFTAAGTPTPITSDNLGGFGELSLGWNYIKVLDAGSAGARQVNTNLRLDTRFGSNISNSYSLTAQVRLSF